MPARVRLSRRRGWRKPDGCVVVARPSRWGNPFRVGSADPERAGDVLDRARAVELYRGFVRWEGDAFASRARDELGRRDLACWCPLDAPCHADVLLELANAPGTDGPGSARRVDGRPAGAGGPRPGR